MTNVPDHPLRYAISTAILYSPQAEKMSAGDIGALIDRVVQAVVRNEALDELSAESQRLGLEY